MIMFIRSIQENESQSEERERERRKAKEKCSLVDNVVFNHKRIHHYMQHIKIYPHPPRKKK